MSGHEQDEPPPQRAPQPALQPLPRPGAGAHPPPSSAASDRTTGRGVGAVGSDRQHCRQANGSGGRRRGAVAVGRRCHGRTVRSQAGREPPAAAKAQARLVDDTADSSGRRRQGDRRAHDGRARQGQGPRRSRQRPAALGLDHRFRQRRGGRRLGPRHGCGLRQDVGLRHRPYTMAVPYLPGVPIQVVGLVDGNGGDITVAVYVGAARLSLKPMKKGEVISIPVP